MPRAVRHKISCGMRFCGAFVSGDVPVPGAKKNFHFPKSKLLNGKVVGRGAGLRGETTTGTGVSEVLPR